jgi:prepilin-type N-terminal cleavage/methylation domain-containing protein
VAIPQNNPQKDKKTQMKIKTNKSSSAFTLIELLVVIAIIAILAAFAVPALTSALAKGQMTGTMNNARQLYIAQFQMSNDGAATGDATSAWPADMQVIPADLTAYLNVLLAKGYLRGGDALKLFSAPGANMTGTVTPAGTNTPETLSALGGIGALKVYRVQDSNPAVTIFCVTHNYNYAAALTGAGQPYGTKGFIVVKKGGDASIFREGQATTAGWANNTTFQTQVGIMPGDNVGGAVGTEPAAGNTYHQP